MLLERMVCLRYAKISKGNHSFISRFFKHTLKFSFSILGIIEVRSWDNCMRRRLTEFEPLIAFRIKMYVTCIIFFGAWPKPESSKKAAIERMIVIGLVTLLSTSYGYFIYLIADDCVLKGVWPYGELAEYLSILSILLVIVVNMVDYYFHPDIADIAYRMFKDNSGTLQDKDQKVFDSHKSKITKSNRWWPLSWIDILKVVLSTMYFVTNALSYSYVEDVEVNPLTVKQLMTVVVLNSLVS